jgi:hypothetical protein
MGANHWRLRSAGRASFYLHGKAAWWPSASPWPWAGSDLTPMVGTLPAKDRSDHLP